MKMATWVKSYDHLKPNEAKKGVWHPCVLLPINCFVQQFRHLVVEQNNSLGAKRKHKLTRLSSD